MNHNKFIIKNSSRHTPTIFFNPGALDWESFIRYVSILGMQKYFFIVHFPSRSVKSYNVLIFCILLRKVCTLFLDVEAERKYFQPPPH